MQKIGRKLVEIMAKTPKGTVAITADKSRLRLRWQVESKRYTLYLGIPDNPQNRKFAQAKAISIELDINSGNFDGSLAKYREKVSTKLKAESEPKKEPSPSAILQQYTEHCKHLDPRTIQKYSALVNHLRTFESEKQELIPQKFIEYLKQFQQPRTIRDRLAILKAAWKWAIKENLVPSNIWDEINAKFIKTGTKQPPKPFSKQEIGAILEGFENHKDYCFYYNYVRFLFLTGFRTGEAVGLRWRHIADNFSHIWVGEIITNGQQKPAKNHKDRIFPCNQELGEFLSSIKPAIFSANDLIFVSPKGKPINANNFCRRAWRTILTEAGIPFRKPYNTRHTFVSHCLVAGMHPLQVAPITGHDVQVLYKNYAGNVSGKAEVPRLT
ncbi:tyrosine-type recombinase/integrase [Ancylothrix sp. C2]|uniref:tyrosine-type recombinase/integrase n=1 Tax=Ancylothrix sp. D3o TaxID=2953691 RepID=UPI0021BA82AA|nr:tyrosine-type recombinase/integrase [Ancylothrix sp. D3o]MCT7948306.1 tyrosine-type recombinase/integrase [Ancylothrix sp. D3o]